MYILKHHHILQNEYNRDFQGKWQTRRALSSTLSHGYKKIIPTQCKNPENNLKTGRTDSFTAKRREEAILKRIEREEIQLGD